MGETPDPGFDLVSLRRIVLIARRSIPTLAHAVLRLRISLSRTSVLPVIRRTLIAREAMTGASTGALEPETALGGTESS
jgi:hypothetical protein